MKNNSTVSSRSVFRHPFPQVLLTLIALMPPIYSSAQEAAKTDATPQPAMTTRQDVKQLVAPRSKEDVFQFIVYGDRTGGVPAGLKVLEQAVVDTNLLAPDLVMTVGDLIQGYNEAPEWMEQMQEFKDIMDRLKMDWYPVAGNHDIYWRGQGETPEGHHEANYEKHFGPLWYSFAHKKSAFVVLYSDEGDRDSNRKAFNIGALQNMSEEQLAFLDKALAEHKNAEHVFVFLHHPRWIGGGYEGSNWDVVHEKLAAAGNVTAVFAGHIHHVRYDGVRDGIEYHTLATTGGHLNGDIPGAGYLHHFNVVTVRDGRVSIASLPVGAVMNPKDFTPDFLAEIDKARTIRPEQSGPPLMVQADGSANGDLEFTINNPCERSVAVSFMLDPETAKGQWLTTLDHQHHELAAGESFSFKMPLVRVAGSLERLNLPVIRVETEYLGEKARVAMPEVLAPVNVKLGQLPADFFTSAQPHALDIVGPNSAVRVEADAIRMEDGPMTIEAWVKPKSLSGYSGIVAKTQGSEFALFSDEGVPQFDIHLGGNYVTAKATKPMQVGKWTHLAGVFDGNQVMIFVDGKLAGKAAGKGPRKFNDLPLFIGADPDGSGRPTRPFDCFLDEVRLSKTAVYSADFSPARKLEPNDDAVLMMHLDRAVGPFTIDHGNQRVIGLLGSESKLVPVETGGE